MNNVIQFAPYLECKQEVERLAAEEDQIMAEFEMVFEIELWLNNDFNAESRPEADAEDEQ